MRRADAQARWQAVWSRRGAWALLLWPLSLLYLALWRIRRWLYATGRIRIERLPVPVIVVGNVVVGGAGKTPTVLALLKHLKSQGWTPGVVSRGHGRTDETTREVLILSSSDEVGDEPCLIRRAGDVPVFVATRRVKAARALIAAYPEVDLVVCDDGLQHLGLGRDISVAVFDDRGVGNGWLLPAGLLREPWPPTGKRSQWPDMVLRQCRQAENETIADSAPLEAPSDLPIFWAYRRLADEVRGAKGDRIPLAALQGQPLVAVAGIARAEVFFDMLRERGLILTQTVALPDHAAPEHYVPLIRALGTNTLVCTEKDAVKLFSCIPLDTTRDPPRCWAVPLELRPDMAFFIELDQRLAALGHRRLSSNHGHQTA